MSTIFISHSSEDNAWAERIRDWLQGNTNKQKPEYGFQSLFLYFDLEKGISVGRSWRNTLYEKLQLCRAVIVICSAAYCKSQWCLAELGMAMASGKLVLPVQIDDSPPLRRLNEIQRTPLVTIDLDLTGFEGWRKMELGLQDLCWQDRLACPPQKEPPASPFPGKYYFEKKHAGVFFGQEMVPEKLLAAIRWLPARQSRLLLTLGASGCGKSWMLQAGVMPWLAAVDRERQIVLEPFRPEEKLFDALAFALVLAHLNLEQPAPAEPARTAAARKQQRRHLSLGSCQQDAQVMIAIDQFEELLARQEV